MTGGKLGLIKDGEPLTVGSRTYMATLRCDPATYESARASRDMPNGQSLMSVAGLLYAIGALPAGVLLSVIGQSMYNTGGAVTADSTHVALTSRARARYRRVATY